MYIQRIPLKTKGFTIQIWHDNASVREYVCLWAKCSSERVVENVWWLLHAENKKRESDSDAYASMSAMESLEKMNFIVIYGRLRVYFTLNNVIKLTSKWFWMYVNLIRKWASTRYTNKIILSGVGVYASTTTNASITHEWYIQRINL